MRAVDAGGKEEGPLVAPREDVERPPDHPAVAHREVGLVERAPVELAVVHGRPLALRDALDAVEREPLGPVEARLRGVLPRHGVVEVPRAVLHLGLEVVPLLERIEAEDVMVDLSAADREVAVGLEVLWERHGGRCGRRPSWRAAAP